MKKYITLIILAVVALASCTRDDDSHVVAPDGEGYKGNVIISLDIEVPSEIPVENAHIYGFDPSQQLMFHEYFPSGKELASEMMDITNGTYTFVAVLNMGDEMPEISRSTNMSMTQFFWWLSNAAPQHPLMMTGMSTDEVEKDKLIRISIPVFAGAEGMETSTLRLKAQLPDSEYPEYVAYRNAATAAYNFRGTAEVCLKGTQKIIFRSTSILQANQDDSYSMDVELPLGSYDVYFWSDYTPSADAEDYYYTTNDLKGVAFNPQSNYTGGSDAREAYYTVTDVELTETGLRELPFTPERPHGRYRLVADDVERYRSLMVTNDYPALEDLSVTIIYEGYLPNSFNVYSGKPNDAAGGYKYVATLGTPTDTEVEVGNDYIFVNGNESSVMVTVQVAEKNTGKLISKVSRVKIAYRRGLLTTLKGDFLTAGVVNSGINIDTNWDGFYDIYF